MNTLTSPPTQPPPDFTATITIPSLDAKDVKIAYTVGQSSTPAKTNGNSLEVRNGQRVQFVVINTYNHPNPIDLVILPQYVKVNNTYSRGGPFHGPVPNVPGVFYMSTSVAESWTIQIELGARPNTYAEYGIVALISDGNGKMDAIPLLIDPSMIINPT